MLRSSPPSGAWLLIGALIYWLYGYRHSLLGKGEAITREATPDDG